MKRTLKYALSAVLTAGMIIPAVAQDNFPDTPDNHWAYEALQNLKAAGILVGYPDGLFRGNRPASRYEVAVAINAAYTRLKGVTDGLEGQIASLKSTIDTMGKGGPSQADFQNLKDQVASLSNDVKGLKAYGDDIANLKRLADTFQKELQALGVDVEALKRDLADLSDRVTRLEKMKPAVDISGDASLWLGAGNSRDNYLGLNQDGRVQGSATPGFPTGVGAQSATGRAGLTQDLTILHEVALKIAGTNTTGPKWKGTIVAGNMLGNPGSGQGFGDQSTWSAPTGGNQGLGYLEGSADVYIQDFAVSFDTSVAGLAFNAEVGRVGYKVSPYIYQRIDKTSYFENDRWDNGKYYFDGGILGFNFGGAKLDVFAGRTPDNFAGRQAGSSVNGTPIGAVVSGPIFGPFAPGGPTLTFDRQLGANLNVPLTSAGNLNLAYLWLDTDNVAASTLFANRLSVFGGSADFSFGKIKVEGGFSQTDLSYNTDNILTDDNTAWNAKIGYHADKWGIWGGYREIQANYIAPGDWGRLGVYRNPTNIKGVQVGAHLDLTNSLTLKASGEFDKGLDNLYAPTTGFDEDTKINKFAVDLGYKVNPNLSLNIGYEDTSFDNFSNPNGIVNVNGKPTYRWTTFGIGYGLSDKAKLSIQYQISDIKHDYQVSDNGTFKGGFLTTQLSVKF